jgi:hypothetical protein
MPDIELFLAGKMLMPPAILVGGMIFALSVCLFFTGMKKRTKIVLFVNLNVFTISYFIIAQTGIDNYWGPLMTRWAWVFCCASLIIQIVIDYIAPWVIGRKR